MNNVINGYKDVLQEEWVVGIHHYPHVQRIMEMGRIVINILVLMDFVNKD